MEEEAPNIMDIYNLNLSSSDAESTASDCDSDNGRSDVIVEAMHNVESQKQSETPLKFRSQDDLMGYVKDMVIQVVEFSSGGCKIGKVFRPKINIPKGPFIYYVITCRGGGGSENANF